MGSPLLVTTYKDFAPIIGKIGSSPGLTKAFFDVPDSTDIALYKPVTASSLDPHIPTWDEPSTEIYNAADGDMITRWKSAASGAQWMQIDLLATYQVNRIKITWENGFGSNYKLDVSADNVNWTNVYSTTAGNGGVDDNSFTAKSARYIKLYGSPSGGYSLWECEVYGKGTVAVEDLGQMESDQVSVYSGEGNGTLSVSFNLSDQKDVDLRLYSLFGQKIFSTQFKNIKTEIKTISPGHLTPGIYICEVQVGNNRTVRKFLVR